MPHCLRSIAALLCLSPIVALAAPHPVHDDGGAVNWRANWKDVLAQSRQTGRPILIQGCVSGCPTCAQLVGTTFKDAKVSGMIRAHFIPFALDVQDAPPDLKTLLKSAGDAHPYVLYLNDKLQPLHSSSGMRDIEQMVADMEKVLEVKPLAMSKAGEAELDKQIATFEKALEEKKYKEATAAWNALNKVKGYSKSREKAYDLMTKAQESGVKKQVEALSEAKKDDYFKAKDLLGDVAKEFAGLPIGDEAKNDQEAVKLLESAYQLGKEMKPANTWKAMSAAKLKTLLTKYPDSPMASLAKKRLETLTKY